MPTKQNCSFSVFVVSGLIGCTTYTTSPPTSEPAQGKPSAKKTQSSKEDKPQVASNVLPEHAPTRDLVPNKRAVPPARFVLHDPGKKISGENRIVTTVPAAEAKIVLTMAFGRYLTDPKQCGQVEGSLEEKRKKGKLVPRVTQSADGSFSAPEMKERAYTIFVGECGASHSDNFGSGLIVILRDKQIFNRSEVSGSSSIASVVDLDGDGRDEILLQSGWTGNGSMTTSMSVVHLGAGGIESVKDLGQVYEGSCAWDFTDKTEEYSVVTASRLSTGEVTYDSQKIKGPCKPDVRVAEVCLLQENGVRNTNVSLGLARACPESTLLVG